ncbi:MAG: phenylalanine--tRNA ligase subunit beta [Bacteroidetes bacterium GWE2_29_8]|nr:MAG: phenylalanine--tRNA ligase subunit beta [Bacteroidetes bacterium GWE2_29_8]
MKISYNWLRELININETPEVCAKLLTDCGLEVDSIESNGIDDNYLKGVIVAEVITKEKHPDADKLSVTTVNAGTGELLQVVCGAPNVDAGQKVFLATIGTVLKDSDGNAFTIKKSKIRGVESFGMICAEDELGLGKSHAGIMVLAATAKIGTTVKDYFNLQEDTAFEIGLTPNRGDAASHYGIAKDLYAAYKSMRPDVKDIMLKLRDVSAFSVDKYENPIKVEIDDNDGCKRYSGLTIRNVEVKESPLWLKTKIKSIGLNPINNIVDITNFILFELGQPLHAFDIAKIEGGKIVVRKANKDEKMITLDEVERSFAGTETLICNASKPMCIGGIFGGLDAGISNETKDVFIESAYFNPTSIRKTSKQLGIKTDSAYRFERGTDPEITVYALKLAAILIKECTGGYIDSDIVDVYKEKIPDYTIQFRYNKLSQVIGFEIDKSEVKNILNNLAIKITKETDDELLLEVPRFKYDVEREIDVIEEILRIYNYNKIPLLDNLNTKIINPTKDDTRIKEAVSNYLSYNGFNEAMNNSLTSSKVYAKFNIDDNLVPIVNPLSEDLNVLRKDLLFCSLETILYNLNRKINNIKIYEFGKIYSLVNAEGKTNLEKYKEETCLAISITGNQRQELWNKPVQKSNFFDVKEHALNVLARCGIEGIKEDYTEDSTLFENILTLKVQNNLEIGFIATVKNSVLKHYDINQPVHYAIIYWEKVFQISANKKIKFKELSKFQSVKRDLSLLIDKHISFSELKEMALKTERKLLKEVSLFDVYEGKNLDANKKSYSLRFILLDENKTLTDKDIEQTMNKLIEEYKKQYNAVLR